MLLNDNKIIVVLISVIGSLLGVIIGSILSIWLNLKLNKIEHTYKYRIKLFTSFLNTLSEIRNLLEAILADVYDEEILKFYIKDLRKIKKEIIAIKLTEKNLFKKSKTIFDQIYESITNIMDIIDAHYSAPDEVPLEIETKKIEELINKIKELENHIYIHLKV